MKEQQHSEILSRIKHLKEKLVVQREKFDKFKLEMEKKKRLEEERAKMELELKQQNFERHAQTVKKLALQFKEVKQVEEKKRSQSAARQKEVEKLNLKRIIDKNLPKVRTRQYQANTKVVEQFDQKTRAKILKDEEQQRIRDAIESYSFRPKVDPSFKRVISDTQSLVQRKETKIVKPSFRNNNQGYGVNQLMNDQKFRLQTALFEAGLHTTDYAKNLMTNLAKNT